MRHCPRSSFSLSLSPPLLSAVLFPTLTHAASLYNAPLTEATSDGSGSAPYLSSPSFLLFALLSLLIGLPLLFAGHRLWRLTTSLGLSLLTTFVVSVVLSNTLPAGGFSTASEGKTGIIVWALCAAGGVVGGVVGAWLWRVGVVAMGACAGLALGLGVDAMGENGLVPVARWVVMGVLAALGTVVLPLAVNSVGMIVATSITGSFLVFLGVDLFVNSVNGLSLALRYILDGNSAHAASLVSYSPPVSTRIFLAASWAVALIAMAFQWYLLVYRQRLPFIRAVYQIRNTESFVPSRPSIDFDMASDYRLPPVSPNQFSPRSSSSSFFGNPHQHHFPSSPAESDEPEVPHGAALEMQERYRLAVESPATWRTAYWSGETPLLPPDEIHRLEALDHARGYSHPEEPPSRPASIVSSAFAAGLQSRPPTFFDEPLYPPTTTSPPSPGHSRKPTPPFPLELAPLPLAHLSPTAELPSFLSRHRPSSFPANDDNNNAASQPPLAPLRRLSIPSSVPVGPHSEDGASVLCSSGSNGLASQSVGGKAAAAFSSGLQTGEVASLPATNGRTNSSGGISTLLGRGKFSNPPRPLPALPSPRLPLPSPLVLPSPVVPNSASTIHPPTYYSTSAASRRPSGETDRSFATTVESSVYANFPSTPTSARTASPTPFAVGRERVGAEGGAMGEGGTEELR